MIRRSLLSEVSGKT